MTEANGVAKEEPAVDEIGKKEKKRLRKAAKHLAKAEKAAALSARGEPTGEKKPLSKRAYERELERLQIELVKLQYWVKHKGLKVVLIFEGRDAAGKGGMIKRITEGLNPRGCRVVALATPSDREKTQWYFQRYVAHLPSAGEIVIFDRSW